MFFSQILKIITWILMKTGRILIKTNGICATFKAEFDFECEIGPNNPKS